MTRPTFPVGPCFALVALGADLALLALAQHWAHVVLILSGGLTLLTIGLVGLSEELRDRERLHRHAQVFPAAFEPDGSPELPADGVGREAPLQGVSSLNFPPPAWEGGPFGPGLLSLRHPGHVPPPSSQARPEPT